MDIPQTSPHHQMTNGFVIIIIMLHPHAHWHLIFYQHNEDDRRLMMSSGVISFSGFDVDSLRLVREGSTIAGSSFQYLKIKYYPL